MLSLQTIVLAMAGAAVAAILWLTYQRFYANKGVPHFRRQGSLISAQQQAFYQALVRAVGPHPVVFPRANLSFLVEYPGDDSDYQAHWRRVCRRWLDFVVCSPSSVSPVLAIKLESRLERGRRHMGGLDVLKDTLTSARIPLLRLPLADDYDPAEVKSKIKWVLMTERHKQDTGLFDTEEMADPSAFTEFARTQLPTFSRWTASLTGLAAAVARVAIHRHSLSSL